MLETVGKVPPGELGNATVPTPTFPYTISTKSPTLRADSSISAL